ncbi:MAG: preprotein translocase subunit SecG [Gemmatimonadota bacterium]|nr:preprotein translocase subunit SecG [Gemmatimonadota bacterium]
MLLNILLVVQFLLALGLIIVILLQADKGSGLSGAFGGGASHTRFGMLSGGTPMGKATVALGTLFLVNSIFMAYLARSSANQFITDQKTATEQTIPAPEFPMIPDASAIPDTSGTTAPVEVPAPVETGE